MDSNYQTYLNRVMRLTLLESYDSQVQHIQESPKFKRSSGDAYEAVPFPGYTVITPPWEEETGNESTYQRLEQFQTRLVEQLGKDLLIPLPVSSFHLTVADLIWDAAYRHASENPEFEEKLQVNIAQSFEQCRSTLAEGQAIILQVLGLMVMPRAIGVCLAPREEHAYDRLLKFRRSIYQNPALIGIGIEQQYHFTAHITLGYFGQVPEDLDRSRLSQTFNDLNHEWLDGGSQDFQLHRAELRKFDDMTRYYRQPGWAVFDF